MDFSYLNKIWLVLILFSIHCESIERQMSSDGLTNLERKKKNQAKFDEEERKYLKLQNEDLDKPMGYFLKEYGNPYESNIFPESFISYSFAGRLTYLIFENNILKEIIDQ